MLRAFGRRARGATRGAARRDLSAAATTRMNMFSAVNSGIRCAMQKDESAIVFGEDVGFGGVFRCTIGLADEFGAERCFNTHARPASFVRPTVGRVVRSVRSVGRSVGRERSSFFVGP